MMFNCVDHKRKRRTHFHAFMQDFHSGMLIILFQLVASLYHPLTWGILRHRTSRLQNSINGSSNSHKINTTLTISFLKLRAQSSPIRCFFVLMSSRSVLSAVSMRLCQLQVTDIADAMILKVSSLIATRSLYNIHVSSDSSRKFSP